MLIGGPEEVKGAEAFIMVGTLSNTAIRLLQLYSNGEMTEWTATLDHAVEGAVPVLASGEWKNGKKDNDKRSGYFNARRVSTKEPAMPVHNDKHAPHTEVGTKWVGTLDKRGFALSEEQSGWLSALPMQELLLPSMQFHIGALLDPEDLQGEEGEPPQVKPAIDPAPLLSVEPVPIPTQSIVGTWKSVRRRHPWSYCT